MRPMVEEHQLRHHALVKTSAAALSRERLTAVAVSAAVAVALAGSAVGTAYGSQDEASALTTGIVLGTVAVVGAIVTLTVPRNQVGWLMMIGSAVCATGQAATEAGVHGLVTSPGSVHGADYLAAIGPALRGAGWVIAAVCVPMVFPDGRLPGSRWRWLVACALGAVTFTFLGGVLSPHAQDDRLIHWQSPLGLPVGAGGVADAMGGLGGLLTAVAAVGAGAGLVARWRRGGPLVRQQLLLLALAVCLLAVLGLVVIVTVALGGTVAGWVFGLGLLPLPVAIAVATLHYGLYDLRRAANRTLLWLTLSGSVVAIYAAVVVVATLIPTPHDWLTPAVAAAVAAIMLLPLRDAIQRGVNYLLYGRWREPYEVLAGLGEQLEAAADVDRLLDAAVRELATGLNLQDVGVRSADGSAIIDHGPSDTTIPLLAYGAVVGWLTYRAPARQLSNSEQRLVLDLSRQLGGVLHVRLLHQDLQRARERLVLAREEERRRLRRDLHDGIGPGLAGLTLKAETAMALLPPGAAAASQQLQGVIDEIRRMVVDVRRLVEGLRPPALDELGLSAACAQAVGRLAAGARLVAAVRVAKDLPPLPAAVEVAAYRIVVEAVTNTVRHAHARSCDVSLTSEADDLLVTVADDGGGFDEVPRHGNGLAIMQERAQELGGQLTVTADACGVRIEARLPVRPFSISTSPMQATPA
jgi:signal transduction histidine kinase